MAATKKNRVKIGLEPLEARDQMSVVVGGLGDKSGILTFSEAPKTPDAHDRIEIVDTGLGGPGQLHYRINGGAWFTPRTRCGGWPST